MTTDSWASGDFGFFSISFLIGLSSGGDGETDWLFTKGLYDNGVISQNMFSFSLKDMAEETTRGTSFIDFGPPDESAVTDLSDLVWLDVISGDPYWANYVRGLRFGGLSDDIDADFVFSTRRAYIDTTSTCIKGPREEVDFIHLALIDVVDTYTEQENTVFTYFFDCSRNADKFKSIYFLFGDHWFEMTPEQYLYFGTFSINCSFCIFGYDDYDYWVLGSNFLRDWYSVHDYDNQKFGFVPQINSARSSPDPVTEEPTRSIYSYRNELK